VVRDAKGRLAPRSTMRSLPLGVPRGLCIPSILFTTEIP